MALLVSMILCIFTATPAFASAEAGAPVIMSFEGETGLAESGTVMYRQAPTTLGGGWKHVNVGGVDCIQPVYQNNGVYSKYTVMPKFKSAGMVTADMKYVSLVYMTSEPGKHSVTMTNPIGDESVAIATGTYISAGKWIATTPVNIGNIGAAKRYAEGFHNILQFSAEHEGAVLYLKEMVFFSSLDQASAYFADPVTSGGATMIATDPLAGLDSGNYNVWRFDAAETLGTVSATLNAYTTKDGTRTTEMKYTVDPSYGVKCGVTVYEPVGGALGLGDHRITAAFIGANKLRVDLNYVAVTYLTTSTAKHGLTFRNTGGAGAVKLTEDTSVSGGKWVTVYAPVTSDEKASVIARMNKSFGNMGLIWNGANTAGEALYVREIVFFKNESDAKAYADGAPSFYNGVSKTANEPLNISVGGAALGNYRIVVAEEANKAILEAADALNNGLSKIVGKKLAVVTDKTAAVENEILLGKTNRSESEYFYVIDAVYGAANAAKANSQEYRIRMIGNKLQFASAITFGVKSAVNGFFNTYIHDGISGNVALGGEFSYIGTSTDYTAANPAHGYAKRVNVSDPVVFTENFSSDKGYFTEEDGKDSWKYVNGALTVAASDSLALSYIHVYEYNAAFDADFSYSGAAGDGAAMGITLRYTGEDGYIRAGYDFVLGEWYIDVREGYDFECYRVASVKAALIPGAVYRLGAKVDGDVVSLAVNGNAVISAEVTAHRTPGRVGVYAKGVNVSVDNAVLTLLSGEGTILRYVDHTVLRKDATFDEGATPVIMSDGSIILTRSPSLNYKSLDGGRTWENMGQWTDYAVCPSFLRLQNGSLMKLDEKTVNGVKCTVAEISKDDGATWTMAGTICTSAHSETGKTVGNMNDKLTQVRSGRIFASMTYNGGSTNVWHNFIIFYYSDDNGVTWHKSLDTRDIEGHGVTRDEKGAVGNADKGKYFGEAKIIQCADGRVRMLSTWNNYPCMVYCDSFDNGVTWGPIQRMDEFTCNRSSYAIARDTTADNDTTYYMVWCYDLPTMYPDPLPRTRLALAKTEDGINWKFIGDIWRWEYADCVGPNPNNGNRTLISQIIDPAINVTADNIIVCSGISEYAYGNIGNYHNAARQNVWTIAKDTLPTEKAITAFSDVPAGYTYSAAVAYAVEKGLFAGMSETAFEPYTAMNRAMFVTVLGRLEGINAGQYTKVSFTDVVPGSWSAPYVEWAASNGVVSGMGDGTFGGNQALTVQQACLMLYRYAGGKTASSQTGITVADFADGGAVAGWAREGVDWALSNGIYVGHNGNLSANAPASRGLVAAMFYNYVKAIAA